MTELEVAGHDLVIHYTARQSGHVTEIGGHLTERDAHTILGKVRLFRVGIADAGVGPHSILSGHGSLAPFIPLYLEHDAQYTPEAISAGGGNLNSRQRPGDLLVFDRLELVPALRKKDIARAFARHAVHSFSESAEVLALKAFPLQHESASKGATSWVQAMAYQHMEASRDRATAALVSHYESFGCKALGGTNLMLKVLG